MKTKTIIIIIIVVVIVIMIIIIIIRHCFNCCQNIKLTDIRKEESISGNKALDNSSCWHWHRRHSLLWISPTKKKTIKELLKIIAYNKPLLFQRSKNV